MTTCKRHLISLWLLATTFLPVTATYAEPVLNFLPNNGATFKTDAACEQGGCSVANQTRFATLSGTLTTNIVETVDINGTSYLHQIMGDPATGFAQEVYVEQITTKLYYDGFGFPTGPREAPVGAYLGDLGPKTSNNSWQGGNASDPLNHNASLVTGDGSANPNRVIMRQVLNDGQMMMEFLKDKLDRKPVITMLLNTPDITSTVVIDMRNSTYNDMNISGVMINTMSLLGTGLPDVSFNMATDSQESDIDAGRFTWTSGAGNGGAGGTYTYNNGTVVTSADMQAIDWSQYWDPFEANPWTQYELHPALVGPNRPGP
jgi:hypothetical protein